MTYIIHSHALFYLGEHKVDPHTVKHVFIDASKYAHQFNTEEEAKEKVSEISSRNAGVDILITDVKNVKSQLSDMTIQRVI